MRSRKANAVATVIIIVALLVTATIMMQRDIFTSESSALQRTLSAFARNVYESPDDMVERYAANGYQLGQDSVWYCSDYASPPDVAKTMAEFPAFATANLQGRIASLAEEYPAYDISVSAPLFELLGPGQLDLLPDETVSVRVTNLTVTVRDGDRYIETGYDQTQDYAYRFWYIYKVLQGWIKCDNAGIFGTVESVLESRSCAFFKDMAFCAQHDWTSCEGGLQPPNCNTCACGKNGAGLPLYTEEDCAADDPKQCQDFTNSERESLKDQYGVTAYDLQAIGDAVADTATETFAGDSICPGMDSLVPGPTGITCTARVENPQIENHFRSSYAYHPTGCIEQVDGTAGVVPINTFDSLLCAGAPTCPPLSVLDRPDLISQWISNINSGLPPRGCDVVELEDDNGDPYTVVQCRDGTVIGGEGVPALPRCTWAETFGHSTEGAAGEDTSAPPSTIQCNPRPADADPGPGDLAATVLNAGDPKLKSIVPDSLWWQEGQDSRYLWFGTNGWLDRRGSFDLTITCSDPGVVGERPMQTSIRLRVAFRHGCDTDQARMRGWSPPTCAVPGVGNQQDCTLACDDNPCVQETCERDPGTGAQRCVPVEGASTPATCILPGNPCFQSQCVTPEGSDTPVCDPSGTLVPREGAVCGPEGRHQACSVCNSDGQCVPRPPEEEYPCLGPGGNKCQYSQCVIQTVGGTDVGRCGLVDAPPDSPCGESQCGECTCSDTCGTGGTCREEWAAQPDQCDGIDPAVYWTSCTDQATVSRVCEGTVSRGYECVIPGNAPPEFDTDVCCPPAGTPTSAPCSGPGEICCQGSFCTAECTTQ